MIELGGISTASLQYYPLEVWIDFMPSVISVVFFIMTIIPKLLIADLKKQLQCLLDIQSATEKELGTDSFSLELEHFRRRNDIICQLAEKIVNVFGLPLFLDCIRIFLNFITLLVMSLQFYFGTIGEIFHFLIVRHRVEIFIRQLSQEYSQCKSNGLYSVVFQAGQNFISSIDQNITNFSDHIINAMLYSFYHVSYMFLLCLINLTECKNVANEVGLYYKKYIIYF